jgi:hypothetical protein
MFALPPAVLRSPLTYMRGGNDKSSGQNALVRTREGGVEFQHSDGLMVLQLFVPGSECADFAEPDGKWVDEMHKLPLGAIKTVLGGAADNVHIELPCAARPDKFHMRLVAGVRTVRMFDIAALQCDAAEWLDTMCAEFVDCMAATFHCRELRDTVTRMRELAVAYVHITATLTDVTFCGTSTSDRFEEVYSGTKELALFAGGSVFADDDDGDSDGGPGDVPRKRRRPAAAAARKVARVPNTVLNLSLDAARFKPFTLNVKALDRVLACSPFCDTVVLTAVGVRDVGQFARLQFNMPDAPRLQLMASLTPAIDDVAD